MLLIQAIEVAAVGKAALDGDLVDALAGGLHQLPGLADAAKGNVVAEGDVGGVVEVVGEVVGAHEYLIRGLLQGDPSAVIGVDVLEGGLQSAQGPAGITPLR